MKAIILAAGKGERLQDVLKGKPKPLLEIKGKSLLEHSLKALNENGVKEIIIATGYKREMIKQELEDKFNNIDISFVENELYDKTGSMHSLFLSFSRKEDILVLDGDIVYNPKIIQELLDFKEKNAVILTECCGRGDEVFVSLDMDDSIAYLGKDKPSQKNLFEFTGISKFSKEFLLEMCKLHEDYLSKNLFGEYYEDCANRVSKFIPWYGLKTKYKWSEIDRKEDIPGAKNVLGLI